MSRITGYILLRKDEAGRAERKLLSLGGAISRHGPVAVVETAATGSSCAADPANQVFVWFDGLLFNRASLASELGDAHTAGDRRSTDAELVIAAYRTFGAGSFSRLSGQFAIVLVDLARGQCLLVRDQLGAKSLHYVPDGGVLWFSTAFRPLLALTGRTRVDVRGLLEFAMHGDVLPPGSMFDGISTLPFGTCLTVRDETGRFESAPFHDLLDVISESTYERLARLGADAYLAELDGHLNRSMQENIGGADSCAVGLSGGVDSAVVMAVAARHTKVQAIHLSVPHGKQFDERPMAEAVAKKAGVPIDVVTVSADLYRRELAAATFANEMPLWHVQNLGFHLVARRARELGQATVFTGDTTGMTMSASANMSWRGLQRGLAVLRRLPDSASLFLRKLGNAAAGLPLDSHGFPSCQPLTNQLVDGYARSELQRRAEERLAFVPDAFNRRVMAGRLVEVRQWYNRFYYRGERLTHEQSIGFRSPLGDIASLGFAMNLPFDLLYRNGAHKWGLKELGSRYVGREVAYQKKISWNMPSATYFKPFATPRFFEDGFCAEAFSLSREAIAARLPGWLAAGQQMTRLVHIEVWGRLFARGESVDEVAAWLASF